MLNRLFTFVAWILLAFGAGVVADRTCPVIQKFPNRECVCACGCAKTGECDCGKK